MDKGAGGMGVVDSVVRVLANRQFELRAGRGGTLHKTPGGDRGLKWLGLEIRQRGVNEAASLAFRAAYHRTISRPTLDRRRSSNSQWYERRNDNNGIAPRMILQIRMLLRPRNRNMTICIARWRQHSQGFDGNDSGQRSRRRHRGQC